MKVYIVCENIDLGYRIEKVCHDKLQAEMVCASYNQERRAKSVANLVKHCDYTQQQAEDYVKDSCFIEEHAVE